MLVFPQWRPELLGGGCRVPRWMPAERFAPYLAKPIVLPTIAHKVEDEDSSGGSSPEHNTNDSNESEGVCGWRGCGAKCTSVARLSLHVARTHAHAQRDGLFYCGWKGCSRPQKGFNARYKMLVHVRTHTNERPHTCNQCNKSFSRAENLKIHLRSHSREKPYVCPYEGCGKAYSNSSDRFKHTRTHIVDKPYCCKVPGCNKRYTDPSSLRKHVKTYKHFTTEEKQRRESSDEVQSEIFSPISEAAPSHTKIEPVSPFHTQIAYSPPRCSISPTMPPYNPTSIVQPIPYTPMMEPVTYITPIESIFPVRVPTHEMSYLEYAQMYDHGYRSYYSNISYPVLRQSVNEKTYTYEEQPRYEDVIMEEVAETKDLRPDEEVPLNLICAKRECHPVEEIIRRSDLPLDLSTKS